MSQALAITNNDHTAADLRRLMSRQQDGDVVRRLSALALVLEGKSRAEAAAMSGMQRQILCDWVRRYNAEGVSGLTSRPGSGRRPELSEAQMQELKALVIEGPDPEIDKVVRWRCVDLKALVARRFAVDVHERTIGKWLRQLGLTRLQPRPSHPKKDAAAQETFKKLRQPEPRCAASLGGGQIDRGVVSGRSAGRAERFDRVCLG